eukprot:CAMPEP_0185526532 /NCGR_PEP_ID=MMETSP1366-20130426/93515_1 /TAXON_ID=38817 /ORGANISM="Gephyrocapsa oceanica, Strain RCC1303" /LENGTH=141 /DNA_ID=CAMNT_0028137979 /DNA_START=15 /DNA_END=437 /DNA_ORIENTATION=-
MEIDPLPPSSIFQPLAALPAATLARGMPEGEASNLDLTCDPALVNALEDGWARLVEAGATEIQVASFIESKIPLAYHRVAAIGQNLELNYVADSLLDLQARGELYGMSLHDLAAFFPFRILAAMAHACNTHSEREPGRPNP